ncbi:hypothetical protein [Thiohalocapsa marina]|uniref:hypothetical protein n=1 Tax=Thiohalocapsa marina TaxID=424902 RepID=UPI0036DDA756
MSQQMLEKAQAAVTRATDALTRALIEGADTAGARRALADALERQADIERKLAAAETPAADPADDAAVAAEAQALVQTARSEALLRIAAHVPAPPTLPELPVAVAETLARARRADAAQRERISGWQAHADKLEQRLSEVRQRRAGIVQRRAEGDVRDDDAQQLALADADIAGLLELVDHHQGAKPAEPAAEAAALVSWQAAVADSERQALLAYGAKLQSSLLAVGAALARSAVSTDQRLRLDREIARVAQTGIF